MRFLITILLLTATCFAKAQSPEMQKEIDTTLELMDIRNMTAESMKSMMELFKQMLPTNGDTVAIDINAMSEEIADEAGVFYKKIITRIVCEKYTLDDLKKINSFMATPEGKKFTHYFTILGSNITPETYKQDKNSTVSPEMQAEIEKTIKLMDIQNFARRQYEQVPDNNDENLDAETIAATKEILEGLTKTLSDFHVKTATNNLKNNYTTDELKQINNFLESADGKLFTSFYMSYFPTAKKVTSDNPEFMEKTKEILSKYIKQ